MSFKEKELEIRNLIEGITVSISDIAEGYGRWQPDLRVDPRLRERLVVLVELCRADPNFGPDFMLPISSCYRPFNPRGYEYERRDTSDPRGHWAALAADVGYQNVLPKYLWKTFLKYVSKAKLKRIHLKKYGEWWHMSDWGRYIFKKSVWRPSQEVAEKRGIVCRALGII